MRLQARVGRDLNVVADGNVALQVAAGAKVEPEQVSLPNPKAVGSMPVSESEPSTKESLPAAALFVTVIV